MIYQPIHELSNKILECARTYGNLYAAAIAFKTRFKAEKTKYTNNY